MNKINKKLVFNDPNCAIKIEHLFCVYNEDTENQVVSLCDNNLELKKNKIYFIIGSSGCGKSTLVNHFNGLLKTRYGNVLVQDNYKIGQDFFLNDFFIGVAKPEDIKDNFVNVHKFNTNNGTYVAFSQKLPKSIIKIIFEAYYKIKVSKVHYLKSKSTQQASYYFISTIPKEYDIQILDMLSLKEIEANALKSKVATIKLLFNKYGKQKKIKKIKNLKKTVGVVFQFPEYQLFKDTVLKDVMFGPLTLGINKEEAKATSIKHLKSLGINETFLERSPFDMSGGQKRRVAIAGILAFNPNIIVFDEPTAGLDPFGEQEILKIIQNEKDAGKTVVVISHNMDHVLQKADHVIVMNEGEIIQVGTPYEIFSNHELIKQTTLEAPKIINLIEDLTKKQPKLKALWDYQPRTIDELANAIIKIMKE